jgi:hypothetical protein
VEPTFPIGFRIRFLRLSPSPVQVGLELIGIVALPFKLADTLFSAGQRVQVGRTLPEKPCKLADGERLPLQSHRSNTMDIVGSMFRTPPSGSPTNVLQKRLSATQALSN